MVAPSAATPLPTLAPTATPEQNRIAVSRYATLQLGDNNTAVSELQQKLMELGYMDGDEPDTLYNESTQNAVMLFQRASDTSIRTSGMRNLPFLESSQARLMHFSASSRLPFASIMIEPSVSHAT